ncbi:MAG TPA: hypothetical protein VH107_07170, partial [Lacipirellulaceae bacterium]|nr:hypothetical protein [Lacipirellulaceae bacterium]
MSRRTRGQWFSRGSSLGQGRSRQSNSTQLQARRLRIEALEDRRMLAAVVVGNASDNVNGVTTSIAALIASPGGDGISLREAILAANATAGADSITFAPGLTGATINTTNLTITGDLDIRAP